MIRILPSHGDSVVSGIYPPQGNSGFSISRRMETERLELRDLLPGLLNGRRSGPDFCRLCVRGMFRKMHLRHFAGATVVRMMQWGNGKMNSLEWKSKSGRKERGRELSPPESGELDLRESFLNLLNEIRESDKFRQTVLGSGDGWFRKKRVWTDGEEVERSDVSRSQQVTVPSCSLKKPKHSMEN